jgi:hypothetical protein
MIFFGALFLVDLATILCFIFENFGLIIDNKFFSQKVDRFLLFFDFLILLIGFIFLN